MFAKKIKRAISFALSLLLLFQGSVPYSLILAQEATESATPIIVEPTPTPTQEPTPTPLPKWQTLDGAEVTTQPVGEGHTYRYKDTAVSVTFTKITQPGLLKIKEVAVGDATGYDITSDMPDGTFIYNLTLPNPNPSQEAKVQYSEDGQTYNEISAQKQNNILVIENLDHFTIFVVTSTADFLAGTSTGTTVGTDQVTSALGPLTLDQSQTAGTTAVTFNSTSRTGQVFTAGSSGFLTQIILSLRVQTGDNKSGNITLRVKDVVGGLPGPTVLAETTINPNTVPSTQGNVTFGYSSPATLTAGTQYALVIFRSGTSNTNTYDWYRSTSDTYPGGTPVNSSNSGSTWTTGTSDRVFSTYNQSYTTVGTHASDVKDTGSIYTKFQQLSWDETLPVGTDITFEVRASNTSFLKDDTSLPWVSLGTLDSPIDLSSYLPSTYQYFQWQATLTATATETPVLAEVRVDYAPTVVWVDDNGTPNGYDNFATIQEGVDAVLADGTVHIAAGSYTTPTTISKSGLTLSCASTGAEINAGGLEIGIALLSGADNTTIENCLITGNGDGINLDNVSGATIRNNTISNNAFSTSGIHILDSSGVVITGNIFSGNTTDISNDSSADVDALDNNWGTFDGLVINDRIYDQLDDGSLGLVQYDADLPAVDAGSDVTTNTSFDRTGTYSDTYGITSASWSQVSGPGVAQFSPFSADTDGTYVLRLTATDYQGNKNSDDFTLVWDTTDPVDPTPTSSSHTIGVWSSDRTIDVTWSGASDATSGVDGYYTEWNRLVDSLLNAATKEYEETASSETSPNRSTAQNHYFHIAALDNAGNWTSTAHLGPFWIDAANPTVSWTTPANDAYLHGTVSLRATASDVGSGVEFVRFRKKPTGGNFSTISTDYSDPYSGSWNTTTVADGTYVLRAGARDNSGRTRNADINVTVDNTPPQTSIDSSPASLVATSSADFTFSANETATFECQLDAGGFSGCTSPLAYSGLADGSHTFEVRAVDQAGNTDSASHTWTVDTTPPTVSWTTPTSGSVISGSTPLEVSISETATTEFSYQRQDGIDTFHPVTSPWDTSSLPLDNYTLRVVVTDTAGNPTTKDETIQVAAVVSSQSGSTPSFGQITITWTTDRPTSGRVVYDTVSHDVLGAAPNYGYAFSTDTIDSSPKTTSHTITITGLSDSTTYYWRTVSAGSPTAIGPEYSSRTFSIPSGGGGTSGGGGGGGEGTVLAAVTTPRAVVEQTEEVVELIPKVATSTPVPTPVSQVKGASTFNWWYLIIPAALLGLIISGLLLWRRP